MNRTMIDRMNCKGNFLLLAVCFELLVNSCAFDSLSPTHLYFKSLCSQEAREQIFRTVDHVDSIFQMRVPAKFDTTTHPPLYDHGKLSPEKGTGYFSDTFNGRPRLLSVDSNPNAAAIVAASLSPRTAVAG